MTREEIDTAIARHAETELLYDRPYEDKKVVRVAGPFTVESLSPHRVVADGPEDHAPEPDGAGRGIGPLRHDDPRQPPQGRRPEHGQGRAPRRSRRSTRSPAAGSTPRASTSRTSSPGACAVAIGPEFGTVGPELVREAAKEAVGYFDLLVICGFAFDAHDRGGADQDARASAR